MEYIEKTMKSFNKRTEKISNEIEMRNLKHTLHNITNTSKRYNIDTGNKRVFNLIAKRQKELKK